MSETPIDDTVEGATKTPIEASHLGGPPIPRPSDESSFRFGAETDYHFLEWSDEERASYLHKLGGERARRHDEVELDFAVKERLAQFLQLEQQLVPQGSDDRLTAIKSNLPTAARYVETARQRYHKLKIRMTELILFGLALIPFLAAPAWEVWLHVDHGLAVLAFGAIYLLVAIVTQFAFLSVLNRQSAKYSVALRVAVYLILVLYSMFIISFVFVGLFQRDHDPGLFLEFAGGVGLVLILYLLYWWALRSIAQWLLVVYYRDHARPSQVLLIDLVDLATRASPLGWDDWEWWFRTFRVRQLFGREGRRPTIAPFLDQLEAAARRSEYLFSRIIPLGHRDLRLWASDRGRRIATVLRAHKQAFTEVTEWEESSIWFSLLNGAVSVARADWEAFLVVQPTPVVHSLIRRFGGRIVLAALLASGALVIPWLFPSLVPPTAAMQFRVTLLVTAVFSLLRPDLDKAREALTSFRQ
jgi:hypothetical protein